MSMSNYTQDELSFCDLKELRLDTSSQILTEQRNTLLFSLRSTTIYLNTTS